VRWHKRVSFKVTGKLENSQGDDVGLDASVLLPDRAFMRDWCVIGPFYNRKGANGTTIGLGIAYAPEQEFDTGKIYTGKDGKPIQWKAFHTDSTGYVGLMKLYLPNQFTVAYGVSYVYSPNDRDAPLFIGSDDGLKVWVKGGANPDQDTVVVRLADGWNKVMLKVEQGWGEWGFYSRGPNPQADLRFSSEPKQGR
jgi:hypothetical protein